jgi:hypothetical protein
VPLQTELQTLRTQKKEPPKDDWQSEQAVSQAAMAVLLPHLVNERNAALGTGSSSGLTHSAIVAALRQRASMLQEENDELYAVLRRAETGRLDEEAKGLRKLIGKLERSLKGEEPILCIPRESDLGPPSESNETVKFLTYVLDFCSSLHVLTFSLGRNWNGLMKYWPVDHLREWKNNAPLHRMHPNIGMDHLMDQ